MPKQNNDYLHGFSSTEQRRLIHQAKFLKEWVYPGIQFNKQKHIIEVGCGVGAQTEILLKTFPHLKITGVDLSANQLQVAEHRLKKYIRQDRVNLVHANAADLPFRSKTFDGAFLCWFLEHVPKPKNVLLEVQRVLIADSPIYCTEVFNSTLFVDPYSPALLKYWFEFNDFQWSIQGHPFIGAQLGNLLMQAKFKNITTELRPFHFDSRHKTLRKKFIHYWTQLMLSAAPPLLRHHQVTPRLVNDLRHELTRLSRSHNSVFFYSFMRAIARA